MKKIDLHIHTVATISDFHFDFSLEKLIQYVEESGLDAIALTNHNMFDGEQYRSIKGSLSISVFPGIEINLCNCHILLISDGTRLDDFEAKTAKVTEKIKAATDSITVDEMKAIFGNLDEYLIIPHYDKKPAIQADTLSEINAYVSAGEVDSQKKFIRAIKDDARLTPVLFSDSRISDGLNQLPVRQTFIDCGTISLAAIKTCLNDKNKVFLSEHDGNQLFQIFSNGQMMSTGLNVFLGERSTGKTYTLDRINECHDNVKYIEQFSLVQKDEDAYEKEFNSEVERRRSRFTDEFLRGFKSVVEDVIDIDHDENSRQVENYVSTLLKSAEEADRRDAFSKTVIFDETAFSISNDKTLKELIGSVIQLIENVDHRDLIEKHLNSKALRQLACELIERLRARALTNKKKEFVNSLVRDIKAGLGRRTSAVLVKDVDLYRVVLENRKIKRFEEIVEGLKKEEVISEESVQGFRVVARKGTYKGAGEVKTASGKKIAFSEAMSVYGKPFEYLKVLLKKESLSQAELYRYFAKITYQILNKDGVPVSGGERSEYRLLQAIKDAQNYDMLLIDEPESSFDNLFLRSDVNEILRDISKSMPVVVVTHNSTVGATVGANYLLYASKRLESDGMVYRIFSGHPTDKILKSIDGTTIAAHTIMMNSLEAGKDAYEQRRKGYEAIED